MYALGMRNIFMVPLLTIFLLHLFLAEAYLSQINPSNLECDYSSNYTIPSPYKTNLDTLLSNLTATAPYSDALFYNNSVVKDSDAAYGLAQCRPDTSPNDCAVCLYRSALSFSSNCLFARSAAVWFDNCFFRYSDHRFFSQLDDKVLAIAVNAGNISNPMVFSQPLKELMYEVTSKAQRNETRFASASFNYSMFGNIYGIAECTRDLTDVDCSTCLNQSLPLLLQQANSGRPGCRVISFSCSLRFELYPILPPPLPPPPKSPNPTDNGNRDDSMRTVLTVALSLVVGIGLVSVIYLCLRKSRIVRKLVFLSDIQDETDLTSGETKWFELKEENCRAAVRVRRCKKLPATLYYSALTYEFTVRVELGRGEPPLPWDLAPEKTAAPGGVWADSRGEQLRTGKNPVGPVVNVREATDKTYEKQGYSEPEEQGIRRDAATTVHTKSGGSGAARIPRHGGLAGVDGESTDGWDNEDRVNERARSRHVENKTTPSDARVKTRTRSHVPSCESSRASPLASHMAQSHPPSQNIEKSQPSTQVSLQTKSNTQPPTTSTHQTPFKFKEGVTNDKNDPDKNDHLLSKNVIEKSKGKEIINEISITKIKNYPDDGKNENIDTDIDEGYDDQLIQEIELEMENLWNGDLEEVVNTQHHLKIGSHGESQDQGEANNEPEQWKEQKGGSKVPNVIINISHEPLVAEQSPIDRPAQHGTPDKQTPNPDKMTGAEPNDQDREPDLDRTKYKWSGYMAPEYLMHGEFSTKSDVFSYGVLVLEIVTGQKNRGIVRSRPAANLVSHVWRHWHEGTALELMDRQVGDGFPAEQVLRCMHVGLLCVQEDLNKRPSMASVVNMLSSYSTSLPTPLIPGFFTRCNTTMESDENSGNVDHVQSGERWHTNGSTNNRANPTSINEISLSVMEPR
ncbi:hypothetical protein J5N97_011659 [Dioscorea zingiberensis]|uniref:Gnk2-homologous domain-containing protein n=1 Tax=Dioscorea zingiberensis TaxID=325984 RepID=A0A9D5HNQ7_9LILI|nr:hypothetical protein J5N97_011659 [Dioscorea zingiberensis]